MSSTTNTVNLLYLQEKKEQLEGAWEKVGERVGGQWGARQGGGVAGGVVRYTYL
jgi:hypothetical protein